MFANTVDPASKAAPPAAILAAAMLVLLAMDLVGLVASSRPVLELIMPPRARRVRPASLPIPGILDICWRAIVATRLPIRDLRKALVATPLRPEMLAVRIGMRPPPDRLPRCRSL